MISFFNEKEIKKSNKSLMKNSNKEINSQNICHSKSKKNPIQIFIAFAKILKFFLLSIINPSCFSFSEFSFMIAKNILINPLISIVNTWINLILLPIRISKFFSKVFIILFLLKLLNFTLSKKHTKSQNDFKTIIANNENFFSNLNKEYSSFLKKYEKDSCIMQVFNTAKLNCNSEKTDEINPFFAYKMTQCFFKSVGKKLPECKQEQQFELYNESNSEAFLNIKKCIKNLEGDAWTTFINFLNHIDNLCFFHKTLLWEKSSEFIYSKMLNSSISILTELSQGSNIAKRILLEQEKFSSQLKDNMTDTLEEFKKIQTYFESFEKLEAKIKNDMLFIEEKINKNNQNLLNTLKKLSSNFKCIDGFFFNKSGDFILKFYVFLFVYTWIFAFNSNVNRLKIKLFFIIIFFLCCEKLLFEKSSKKNSKDSNDLKINKNFIRINNNLEDEFLHTNNSNSSNGFIKDKFEIFQSLKFSFATLLNSTFAFDNYLEKDNFLYFNRFESFFYSLYLYVYRLLCFLILNIICCIIKGNQYLKENDKNYFEKFLSSNRTSGYFSNISNSKGSITPLWMKKYFSRIQDKNEELLEKFKLIKTKLNKGNNSLTATPSFEY